MPAHENQCHSFRLAACPFCCCHLHLRRHIPFHEATSGPRPVSAIAGGRVHDLRLPADLQKISGETHPKPVHPPPLAPPPPPPFFCFLVGSCALVFLLGRWGGAVFSAPSHFFAAVAAHAFGPPPCGRHAN